MNALCRNCVWFGMRIYLSTLYCIKVPDNGLSIKNLIMMNYLLPMWYCMCSANVLS